jgi:hypothetical protein
MRQLSIFNFLRATGIAGTPRRVFAVDSDKCLIDFEANSQSGRAIESLDGQSRLREIDRPPLGSRRARVRSLTYFPPATHTAS